MTDPHKLGEAMVFDVKTGRVRSTLPQNDFDRNEGWVTLTFTAVFVICAVVSAYATFVGIRLFLTDVGDVGMLVNGTSVILTIAVCAMLGVGWAVICRWGPEVRSPFLKIQMVGLGVILFGLTLCVSSLPNLMALVGPAAKIADWKEIHTENVVAVNEFANRSLGVLRLRPGWMAEHERACSLADGEIKSGLVSTAGAGIGPVSVALISVCKQTESFVASMDEAAAQTRLGVDEAHGALKIMRAAIRDRQSPVIDREDRFLDAGEAFNQALQRIRSADLSDVLEAGAAQVRQSVAELKPDSSFTAQQVEMVSALREGLSGLLAGTVAISETLRSEETPSYRPVASLDFIAAIRAYWVHFIPAFAAAIGIDCFQIWALMFLLVSKAGKDRHRLRGDFDAFLETDAFVPLAGLQPRPAPLRRRWRFGRTKTHLTS